MGTIQIPLHQSLVKVIDGTYTQADVDIIRSAAKMQNKHLYLLAKNPQFHGKIDKEALENIPRDIDPFDFLKDATHKAKAYIKDTQWEKGCSDNEMVITANKRMQEFSNEYLASIQNLKNKNVHEFGEKFYNKYYPDTHHIREKGTLNHKTK